MRRLDKDMGLHSQRRYTDRSHRHLDSLEGDVHRSQCMDIGVAPHQIAYQRDAYGNVKYTQVGFDGVVQDMTNATGNSAFALGWDKVLLTNFQLDGNGASGAGNAIIDNLTLYKW